MWYGVNVLGGNIDDLMKLFVWEPGREMGSSEPSEPELVRINVMQAACEAACAILNVDQTIRNPASE